jgi:hypothetical protein
MPRLVPTAGTLAGALALNDLDPRAETERAGEMLRKRFSVVPEASSRPSDVRDSDDAEVSKDADFATFIRRFVAALPLN